MSMETSNVYEDDFFDMSDNKYVPLAIRVRLLRIGKTLPEVAKQSGVKPESLRNYMKHPGNFTLAYLDKIAPALRYYSASEIIKAAQDEREIHDNDEYVGDEKAE